jgi:uroporphyrinogen decarboxylase
MTETPTDPTPRDRFIAALERRPLPGRVPHFELVFFLTMEAFGKVHPSHRAYSQWLQMTESERAAQRLDMAKLYLDMAERFDHDAIFLHPNPGDLDEVKRLIDLVRDLSGDRYFLMMHGDSTFEIPDGERMEAVSLRMAEQPEEMEREAEALLHRALDRGEKLAAHGGLDGFALCSDYCFNTGPFMPLDWFDRFVTPYLGRLIRGYREQGHYVIKHTDGNIMPILDRLVNAGPHALHSLDPQGGVDIAEVVRLVGDRVCLCGNVNCALLQTGTDEECIASARYALHNGMKAPGYIFCTSNCIYTGMELRRYELMLDVWRNEGIRGGDECG